jgi:hypothetical protein
LIWQRWWSVVSLVLLFSVLAGIMALGWLGRFA